MSEAKYVAAIEISSSKIAAAVGKMQADGRLDIIATEQDRGIESVRFGIVQNLEETSMRISHVIERLQQKPSVAPREVTGVFVGLSGRSLRSISTEVDINLPDDTEINDDILKRLREQALVTAIDSSLEVIDAIPRIYYIGKLETRSPKGAVGSNIRAVYDLIVCRPELRRNIQRVLTDKLDIEVNGFVVTALSTAQVILSSEEKRLGCILVDMGAETTTVTIYKDGALKYFATLPMGGRNITRDITTLNVLEERAEDIKISMGNAMPRETSGAFNMNGVRMSEVNDLIVARAEEIVANIVEQLTYAGLKDSDLPAGIICIGGAARLNGMLELIGRQTDMRVRSGQLPAYIHVEDAKATGAEILQTASILYSGGAESDAVCLEMPGAEELPVTGEPNSDEPRDEEPRRPKQGQSRLGGFAKRFSDRVSRLFSEADKDDSDLLE